MLKLHSLPLLIGIAFLVVLVAAKEDIASNRKKRQAPSINVHQIPKTSFSCGDKKIGEYYADPETACQVYHVCIPGMHNKLSLISFVCPNGTIFNQATRVCSPFDRVDCRLALKFYETVHGNLDSRRTDFEEDADYVNYVPPPPKTPAPAQRQPPPQRQSSRSQPQSVSRNTLSPPAPEEPARGVSRFRSGGQFRGPQSRSSQTPAPIPPVRQQQPQPPSRQQVASPSAPRQPAPAVRPPPAGRPSPAARPSPPAARPPPSAVRPPPPTFRPPVVAGRGVAAVTPAPAALPPRPTVRTVVSTSTDNYNYEYELEEYEYEDEPEQGNTRSKRDVKISSYADEYDPQGLDIDREPQKTSFSCLDKVPGGVYADMETDCEMFHICIPLSKHKMLDYKVYCANSTAFDQESGSCKSKSEFKCEKAQLFYQLDKLNSPALGKRPLYKKASYSTSKKFPQTLKA